HARFATTFSKRNDDVQRLLDEGTGADIDPLWNAIIEASVALTATPIAFGAGHVARLRELGLGDLAIADLIHSAAFFNWANRLMLSLGEPVRQA
ncbi:MAG: peroxidase-related enzyme, partial [Beijerinckiaceae bacterium]|nr:peroxidase-related enzyme [Beijerinckiaceae bacterium]